MKKFISFIIFLFSIFFIGNVSVYAANNPYLVSSHDINPDTYVIGTHMFDENRTYLSTEDMMWAARTIENAESKEDMVVYYKNYNGEWQNGRTGENITVPSTFKIEEYNGEKAKLVLINTVLEQVEHEGGVTGYSSIHEDDYNEMGILLKNDGSKTNYEYEIMFSAYNFEDGDYNFNLVCHKYDITEDDFIPSPYSIGTMPSTVSVLNGAFRLPVNIDTSILGDYASCVIELEKDDETIESGFMIANEDAEPMLNAKYVTVGYEEQGVGAGSEGIYSETGEFSIIDNEFYTAALSIDFEPRFIEDGDYYIEMTSYKDDEEFDVEYYFGPTITINKNNINPYINFSMPEKLSVGEYEFDITLYDANDEIVTTETVYLTVTDETNMEIIEVWGEPEVWYDIDNFTFDSKEKRKFHMTVDTENIPVGTYAIKAELEYLDMVIPANFDLKAYQNVEVIKPYEMDYFDYYFEVPKGAEIGNYYVSLTLHKIDEDGYPIDTAIAKTGFEFTVAAEAPTLNYETRSGDELTAFYDIRINTSDYSENEVDRWELYVNKEIDGADSIEIEDEIYYLYSENEVDDKSQIEIQNGETLKFVSRVYTNLTGLSRVHKIYSNWSDVTEITYGDGFPTE